MGEKLEYSNTKKEEKHLNEDANLDESRLSVESEIEGREKCRKILDDPNDAKTGKAGGFKKTDILGNNDFIKFFSIKNNNNDVFDYQQCFYYALLRTIEDVKGIKFIGEDIQRFAGDDLLTTFNKDTNDKTLACLCLIAFLLSEIDGNRYYNIKDNVIGILANIENKTEEEIGKGIFNDITTKEISMLTKSNEQEQLDLSKELFKSLLKPVYQHLDDTIKNIDVKGQKVINKFLCQLFFLIFFTNKIDIKPNNILVQKDNNNMEFLHIDFDEPDDKCGAMFATFDQHEQYYFYYGKYFLESLWKRISSDELFEYFDEYIKKYTLTEEKLKKIISRTVKNAFRQNYDIKNNEQGTTTSRCLKKTCIESFERMQKHMQYMLKQLSEKKILLQGGNNKKIETLIGVLESNRKALSDMLQGDKIKKCVEESIDRYKKLKKEVLEEKQHKQSNENINNPANPSTHSNNDSNKQDNEFNIDNDINLDDIKKEINNSNINEQEKSLNISDNVPLSYSSSPVESNNESNIENKPKLNDSKKEETKENNNIYQETNNNLNNDINLDDSKKEEIKETIIPNLNINNYIITRRDINKQDIRISDDRKKNSQTTSCGGILSNIKDFFTQCCSNCGTNDSADINTSSVQVDNTRNIE